MNNLKLFSSFLLAAGLFLFSSCSDDADSGIVTLNFNHTVAGEELEFENMKYLASAGHTYSVSRLKYYVSNIMLQKTDGTTIDLDQIHYRDAGEESTRSLLMGEIPTGDYNGISFTFGLDETTNVDGGLSNTQTNINMEWPIPGDQGYHYMKFEGKYDSLGMGVIKNFNLHTGATMGNQNYINVNLSITPFSIDGNSWKINLELDLNEWLQNPTIFDFEEFGPMIMMNQNAQEVLKANGASVFSLQSVEKE